MSTTEATEQEGTSAQAVDDEYKKLERFHVNKRRIIFIDNKHPPEGAFGIVRRAELHHSTFLPAWLVSRQYGPPQVVAVKQIKISKTSNIPKMKRAFTRELLVWSSLKEHPGIANFLGFYADLERAEGWLLSPWEPNGNVSEFVKKYNLEVPEKLSLVYDTIDALEFLHQLAPPVCHGDIKSANVLVSANCKARLCDFGLARLHEDSGFGRLETSAGVKGSIPWCSPEILNGALREPTSDVYSWAWLVWEIMTGVSPYEEISTIYAIIYKIFENPLPQVNGQSRLSDCLQVWELMKRCWNVDPQQRPTAKMCKTIVTYLPRCTPTPANADHQTRSPALLENLGAIESWKGNLKRSSAYFDEALRLYQEEGDAQGIASVLRKQVVAVYRISDFAKLRAIATTALEHCKALNDPLGIAEVSFYLGFAIQMLGEGDGALPILRESLEIRRMHGDDVGVAQCLERIGEIQRYQGRRDEALFTLGQAMQVTSRSGDRLGMALALHVAGNTYADLSNFSKATDNLSNAIGIAQDIGWEGGLSTILLTMARLKTRLGDYREAEELLQKSVSIARRISDRWGIADGLESLGECFRKQSKPKEAAPLLEEACLLWHELVQPESSKRVAALLVDLKRSQRDWDGAICWHDHIVAVCRSQNEYVEVADHLELKGRILAKVQRYDEAALHFEAAILARGEEGHFWLWKRSQIWRQMCAIPKTAMRWERRLPLLCDLKKLRQRRPQLVTANLKLPLGHRDS